MLDSLFKLSARETTVGREAVAGLTTFLTMVYIVFVNPEILQATGMDRDAVFVATCLAAALGTAIMGFWANYPIALAPGMGLNAFFTYSVVLGSGHTWQAALGAVFLSGVLFLILSILPVREWIINSIPRSLKMAISAGIGFFLAIIGLKSAGIVVDNPVTLVTMGDITDPKVLLSIVGFLAMVILHARKVPGAIVISILGVTLVGIVAGLSQFGGVVSAPPSLAPTFMQMDLAAALEISMLSVIFAFLFVDLFDTAGTLIGVSHQANLLDKKGHLPRLGRALLADSTSTVAGSMLGTSTTTSYIESAAGVNAGGRTGLTSVVTAGLFLLCLFFSPLAGTVPGYATAPALLFVACMMARSFAEIDWKEVTDVAPAVVTALSMPLTFSVSTGLGLGFVTYAAVKLLGGKHEQANPAVLTIAVLFLLKFAFIP